MKFWCNVCDAVSVDSEDKSTGTVYEAVGHVVKHDNKTVEECQCIVFSVCNDCKLEDTVKPTQLELKE